MAKAKTAATALMPLCPPYAVNDIAFGVFVVIVAGWWGWEPKSFYMAT
jgi:hypothetical protein